jgi:hypothetical protein
MRELGCGTPSLDDAHAWGSRQTITIRKPGLFGIIMFAFLFRQCMASEPQERRFRARGGGTPVQMRLWTVSAIEVLVVQAEWHSALCVNAKGARIQTRSRI